MFQIGEYVVVNGAEVGQIVEITQRDLGANTLSFYIIKKEDSDATFMIPTNNHSRIRSLPSKEDVNAVYEILDAINHETDIFVKKRKNFFTYLEKARAKGTREVAGILRTLIILKRRKGLSVTERKLFQDCKEQILIEISLAIQESKESIESKIDELTERLLDRDTVINAEAPIPHIA